MLARPANEVRTTSGGKEKAAVYCPRGGAFRNLINNSHEENRANKTPRRKKRSVTPKMTWDTTRSTTSSVRIQYRKSIEHGCSARSSIARSEFVSNTPALPNKKNDGWQGLDQATFSQLSRSRLPPPLVARTHTKIIA